MQPSMWQLGFVHAQVNGGDGQEFDSTFQPAAHFRPLIDKVYEQLMERCGAARMRLAAVA